MRNTKTAKAKGPEREDAPGTEDLRGIPAFSGMDAADAATFLGLMVERRMTAGEPLLREGEVGDGLLIIMEGSVGITRKNAKGGEREVAVLERHEAFGEMDLLSDRAHTSGAKARTDGRLLFLPKGEFQSLLRKGNRGAASMVLYFARMLAGRLDTNNRKLMDVLDAAPKPAGSEFAEFKRRLLKEWAF